MPSLINRVPPGLLSLLGIKALGQNPSVLSDTIAAEIDVAPLYLQAFSELVANSTTPFTTTGIVGGLVVVPAGEMWIVNRAACYAGAVIGAATTCRIKLVVYESVSQRILLTSEASTATTGERFLCSLQGPLVLSSGEQVAVFCESFTGAAAVTATMAMEVTKLSV